MLVASFFLLSSLILFLSFPALFPESYGESSDQESSSSDDEISIGKRRSKRPQHTDSGRQIKTKNRATFQYKTIFTGIGIPIIKTRQLWDCLIFIMRIPVLVYRNSHHKHRMVMRPSYLYNGNPYTGKTASLYWNDPQFLWDSLPGFS